MNSFESLELIVDKLNMDADIIAANWIRRSRVKNVLSPHKIDPKLFLKHFGHKIISYMIGVINKNNEAGNCPVVHVMLDYFGEKHITMGDMYLICAELKNVFLLHYMKNFLHLDDKIYFKLVDLIDINFHGVLNEYFAKQCSEIIHDFDNIADLITFIETGTNEVVKPEHIFLDDSKKSTRLTDIRFNQAHKTTAIDFMESLDSMIFDKIEEFVEQLDQYNALLYGLEDIDTNDIHNQLAEINEILSIFYDSVNSLSAFPIIVRTFNQLMEFLNSLNNEQLEDRDKRVMLVKMLIGLGDDLENWIKTIFIEQTTDDIHYFDASFANNCIEIEALFCEEELESDEDDLEFF